MECRDRFVLIDGWMVVVKERGGKRKKKRGRRRKGGEEKRKVKKDAKNGEGEKGMLFPATTIWISAKSGEPFRSPRRSKWLSTENLLDLRGEQFALCGGPFTLRETTLCRVAHGSSEGCDSSHQFLHVPISLIPPSNARLSRP